MTIYMQSSLAKLKDISPAPPTIAPYYVETSIYPGIDYQTGQSTTTGHPHPSNTQTPLTDQYTRTTLPFNLQVT